MRPTGEQAERNGDRQRGDRARNGRRVQSMEDVWADAAANCLDRTVEQMKQQQGMDFDWAYVTHQNFMHVKMLSELEAMQNRGSDRFNQLVAQAIERTSGHLEELRRVHETLEQAENNN